ncbi:MAG TPA: TraR/DksA C4-type zinc finger protein [Acidimicrobiales bacterium]|nr:TraR/DksA C4-type zinc finger protein [Acidimicrobiales bacterium]
MDADAARERLSAERDRLLALKGEVDDVSTETEDESLGELSHYDQHQADVGTETFNRERDLSILGEIEGELADVEHALQRIDNGSYGTCEACGKPIDDARLEAMPATRFCVDDQAVAEREARSATPGEE